MADKRMFSKKVTDSDAFIGMPATAQSLYFHLNQSADDDGFNNQIQIAFMKSHASVDDFIILIEKRFIIEFESGAIVIKHWRMHNTLRKDRYTPTAFEEELKQLKIKENQSYTLVEESGCQTVAKRLPQYSIDKYSIDKSSIVFTESQSDSSCVPSQSPKKKDKPIRHKYGEYCNVLLTDEQLEKLKTEFPRDWEQWIERLSDYMESNGKSYKNHLATIKSWAKKDKEKQTAKNKKNPRIFRGEQETNYDDELCM